MSDVQWSIGDVRVTRILTHHPVQWAEVDWMMLAEPDPKQAAATRRRLLGEHANQSTLIIGTHYCAPTAGHLVSHAGGHAFKALES